MDNIKRANHRPNKPLKTSEKLEDKFYTIDEVADILKVHHTTIRRAIKDKRLNAFKIGTKWLIKKGDIEQLGGVN
jgi:excisionase family DNA binding protein